MRGEGAVGQQRRTDTVKPRRLVAAARTALGVLVLAAAVPRPTFAGAENLLPLSPGEAVVTCGAAVGPGGYVLAIVDTTCPVDRDLSDEWNPAEYVSLGYDHHEAGAPSADWTHDNFFGNEVFGVALDGADPPNIYVTSTSCYGLEYDEDHVFVLDGRAGTGFVFRVDGATGAIAQWNFELPNTDYDDGDPDTTGPGLGNVAHDPVNQQLLVTNLEDGKIYLLDTDPFSLTWLGTYDPWTADDGTAGMAPKTTLDGSGNPQPDRIWGVGVFDGRAYFGTWSADQRDAPSS
jgi:hypothetical protein